MQSQPSIPVVSPVILIGTYRREQLEKWILPKGLYNYPISDDDKIPLDLLPAVKELWLFSGTKNQLVFDAEYLGVLDRSQLEDYPKGREKPHGNKYLLFRIAQKYATTFDDAPVIVRANDFAHRSPAIRRQIMEALSSPDSAKRASVAKHLPSAIVSLPPERLRVCEAAVGQLSFWDLPGVQFSVTPIRGYVAKKVKGEPKPFVKWAGGKGQLLEQLDALLPSDFATRENLIYVEPSKATSAPAADPPLHALCQAGRPPPSGLSVLSTMLNKRPPTIDITIFDTRCREWTCGITVCPNPSGFQSSLRELPGSCIVNARRRM